MDTRSMYPGPPGLQVLLLEPTQPLEGSYQGRGSGILSVDVFLVCEDGRGKSGERRARALHLQGHPRF